MGLAVLALLALAVVPGTAAAQQTVRPRAAKAAIAPKFKFRIKRAARGKTTEIKFVARSAGVKNQSAVAKLRVRR